MKVICIENVDGCEEGYIKLAELIPQDCKTFLDLGFGTGLEFKEIFKKFPNLICGNYFDVGFGINKFDCSISIQTIHHFKHEKK